MRGVRFVQLDASRRVTRHAVDAHGADLQLPKVRLGYAGHLQALRWIRREPE